MTVALSLVFVAAVGLLASVVAGRLLSSAWHRRRSTDAVHPWAVAAPEIAIAVPVVGFVVASIALLPAQPWLWLEGMCACEAFGGSHVCPFHLGDAAPLVAATAVAALAVLWRRVPSCLRLWRRLRDVEHLVSAAAMGADGVMRLHDAGHPMVFVAGLRQPRLFVEGTWWDQLGARERAVIVAHEQSHVAARDSWTLLVLDLILALVAPNARTQVVDDWLLATELRADAAAAAKDGDPVYVAEVLCRYARASAPAGTVALGGRGLDARVRSLLAEGVHPRPRSSAPVLAAVLGAAICCGHLSHRLFDGLLTALAWA